MCHILKYGVHFRAGGGGWVITVACLPAPVRRSNVSVGRYDTRNTAVI